MRTLNCAFAASAITVACCSCLLAVLKRVFRYECINGQEVGPGGSALPPTIMSFLVVAALGCGVTTACLVKALSKRARTVVAGVCSKWQPVYFIIVSVQKILLRAIVMTYANSSVRKRGVACYLSADYVNQSLAATFMFDCAILIAGLSTICIDVDADFTPALRRCVQCLLAMCLCVDAVGSCIWGNDMAGVVSLSVTRFEFQLGNMITSCITSQAVLAMHFAFVGWRSPHGRGWYYASLRFELDQRGRALLPQLSLPQLTQGLKERLVASSSSEMAPTSDVEAALVCLPIEAAGRSRSTPLSRARQRLLQFRQRSMSKCRVFVIPCVTVNDGGGSNAEFALARPAFVLKNLRPLQRVADAHPMFYLGFVFLFFGLPSIACSVLFRFEVKGIPSPFLNSVIFVALLGFLSSRRYNLDRVAVKQVALSFRFAIFVVLLSQWIALFTRRAYLVHSEGQTSSVYNENFWTVAATTVLALFFSIILLLDCSPNLPVTAQIIITAGLWLIFGYWGFVEFYRIYAGENPDCFWDLGAYRVCDSTQLLSIFSSLFLLMTQALVSRIVLPGVSNFVNASILHSVVSCGESNGAPIADHDELTAPIDGVSATREL